MTGPVKGAPARGLPESVCSFHCAAVIADGGAFSVTYFDLVKCFEYARLHPAWIAGIR